MVNVPDCPQSIDTVSTGVKTHIVLNSFAAACFATAAALVLLGPLLTARQAQASERTESKTWSSATARRPIQIGDLLALRDMGGRHSGLVLSPDRTVVAFQVRQMDLAANRYSMEWLALPAAGGMPTRIGNGGELITQVGDDTGRNNGDPAQPVAHWSPDSQWLAYLRKSDGQIQIWRSRRDGKTQEQLTHSHADVDRFVWTADGSRLLFRTKVSRGWQRLAEERARDDGFLWDEVFYLRYSRTPVWPQKGDSTVWVLEIDSRSERKASAAEALTFSQTTDALGLAARPHARVVVPSEDGRAAASLEALNPDQRGFRPPLTVVVSRLPDGQAPIVCSAAECTGKIVSVRWHPSGNRLYFTMRVGHGEGQRGLYEWRIGARKARRIYLSDDWIGDDCEITLDNAVCFHESPTRPRSVVAISLADGTLTSLFDPNPEFNAIAFTKVEKVTWQDRYGNETYGHLVYPAKYHAAERYPLVIVQYRSRGFLRGGVGDEYPIHVLAAHGFFVLSWDRPAFRAVETGLSADNAFRFAYTENREHLAKQSALEFILDSLTARGLVDSSRVGITGLSDGAETVAIGLIHSQRFAVAAMSTVSQDPIGYYLLSLHDRMALKNLSGLPAPSDAEYSRAWWGYVSPALNIDKIRAPILMHLSEAEATSAAQFVATLQEAGKPFEAYIYPGEFHIKNQPRHLLRIMERSVDWFNFWLRDVEDPAPEKAEQYVRWRKLRELKGSSAQDTIEAVSPSLQ